MPWAMNPTNAGSGLEAIRCGRPTGRPVRASQRTMISPGRPKIGNSAASTRAVPSEKTTLAIPAPARTKAELRHDEPDVQDQGRLRWVSGRPSRTSTEPPAMARRLPSGLKLSIEIGPGAL